MSDKLREALRGELFRLNEIGWIEIGDMDEATLHSVADCLAGAALAGAASVGPDEVHDAQIRLEEARWWQQTYHLGHLPDCSFDQTDGPEGDYCTCQLNRRKSEAFHRIATLKTNAERALGATSTEAGDGD